MFVRRRRKKPQNIRKWLVQGSLEFNEVLAATAHTFLRPAEISQKAVKQHLVNWFFWSLGKRSVRAQAPSPPKKKCRCGSLVDMVTIAIRATVFKSEANTVLATRNL